MLLVVEMLLLSAAVTARYVFDRPLVWSDELATSLLLWLGMFGAVIALRRSEHMRLTVFLNLTPPWLRGWLDAPGLGDRPRLPARAAAAVVDLRAGRVGGHHAGAQLP